MHAWAEDAAMMPSKMEALTNALADRRYGTAVRLAAEIGEHAKSIADYVAPLIGTNGDRTPLVRLGPES